MPGQSNQITKLAPAANPLPTNIVPLNVPSLPIGATGFVDNFARKELGPDWLNTGGPYRIEQGRLVFEMAHNHPLWLNRALPGDVRIDFDCTALSGEADVKVELFGDGHTYENDEDVRRDVQYTATGYIFIFGGWKNRLSTLVKQQEHAWQYDKTVPRRADIKVEPGRSYHWTITRTHTGVGAHLDWQLDNKEFMSWDDPAPLEGPGHDRFAFEGWESPVSCANSKIQTLAKRLRD